VVQRGRFITLEGGEGAGKSTQVSRLADRLRASGVAVTVTREPGGAPGAERLRALMLDGAAEPWPPMAETLLHYAARVDHLVHRIRPALAAGDWVISDRFADSTMAYQGYGLNAGRRFVGRLHRLVAAGDTPDLTLILDLPPEIGIERVAARRRVNVQSEPGSGAGDPYESRDIAFHRRVRRGFLDIAAREPDRCVVIDATQSVDAIAELIAEKVGRALAQPLPAP
jgi:dTMP kinase